MEVEVEPLMVKVRTSGLEIFERLKSLKESSTVSLEDFRQVFRHIGSEADISNLELLIMAVTLEKLKENAEQSDKNGDVDIDEIMATVNNLYEDRRKSKLTKGRDHAKLICPLSLELMRDPVDVSSGQTYERAFIQKWIDLGITVCPVTRETLLDNVLRPNISRREAVESWCKLHDLKLPDVETLFRDWLDLTYDVLERIAANPYRLEEWMAFRGVCYDWRAAGSRRDIVCKLPLLMLAGDGLRDFYSLVKGRVCMQVSLPEALTLNRRCLDVGFGWLIAIAPSGEMCLFRPFSLSAAYTIPNFHEKFTNKEGFPDVSGDNVYKSARCILTSDPSTSDFTLILMLDLLGLGFWQHGEENLTFIDSYPSSIAYLDGKILSLTCDLSLETWNLADLSSCKSIRSEEMCLFDGQPYLAYSTNGEILVLLRKNHLVNGTMGFDIKRVDVANGKFEKVDDLGEDAIFIGDSVSASVDATKFPGAVKPNCIYFTSDRDCYGPSDKADAGIYHVAAKSLERFNTDEAAVWVLPHMSTEWLSQRVVLFALPFFYLHLYKIGM